VQLRNDRCALRRIEIGAFCQRWQIYAGRPGFHLGKQSRECFFTSVWELVVIEGGCRKTRQAENIRQVGAGIAARVIYDEVEVE